MDENLSGKIVAVINSGSAAGETKLREESSTIEIEAESLIIDDEKSYATAVDFGRKIKSKMADVEAFFAPLKAAAHQAHKAICEKEKDVLQPLNNAERIIKNGIAKYHEEQRRIQREKEEELRRLQEEEAARKLEEAARLEAEGNVEAANDALIEAQVAESLSRTVTAPAYSAPAVAGVSARKDWVVEIVDEKAVPAYFQGFPIRPVDLAAVKKLVKANKGNIEIPGIKITETSNIALRR